jgi:predicted transcriptional regulator
VAQMKASFDLDEVERRFDAGDTVNAVAADLGVSSRTIRDHLHAAGRPLLLQRRGRVVNPYGPGRVRPEVLDDPVWLQTRYVAEQMSVAELARELGVAHGTVSSALIRQDIEPRKRLGSLDIDSAWLHDQYIVQRRTLKEIASEVGVSMSTIKRAAKRDGLAPGPRRIENRSRLAAGAICRAPSQRGRYRC